jgi:nucleoside-diphosphate-sugar epimerase
MLVALTGASGFVGSHVAEALHRAGHRVRVMVRPQSRRDHIAPFVAEWCVGDQADPHAQTALVAGVDAVIHNSYDWHALELSPLRNFEVNVLGSLVLLDAARQAGTRQFLFVSSVSVYHEILQDRPPDERHPTWPNTIYGAAKAAVESHLIAYHHAFGMNTSAWRPAAVYGIPPNLRHAQWGELIRAAKLGGTIDTPQGGKITHVRDVADALTLSLGDDSVAGQLYNLVDCYMYWQTAAESAKELSGSSTTIVDRKGSGPRNQFNTQKAIDFFDRHGNHTALRRGLGGVREYVRELLGLL